MPLPEAPPTTVVRSYLSALNAHDVATAKALLQPHWRAIVTGEDDSPLTNIRNITNVRVGTPQPELPTLRGPYKRWETVYVPVRFDLQQYRVVSMRNGRTSWGYVVGRPDSVSPWRIVNEGVG